jgi:hypothetical protein
MNNKYTGNTTQADQSDWPKVKAMTDAEISHNADSPRTVESDWDGAILKQGGVIIGKARVHDKGRDAA